MKKFILIFLLLAALVSCKERANGILPQSKMSAVLLDYVKVDNYAFDHLRRDSSVNDTVAAIKMQQQVFEKHKVSKEDFERSINYYTEHPKLFEVIIDTVISRQLRKDTAKKKAVLIPVLDSL